MTFVLRAPDRDLDLGGTVEAMHVFAELGRLEPGEEEFGRLHGAVHAEGEELAGWYANALAREAHLFLKLHRGALSDHARWFLEQVAGIVGEFEAALGWAVADVARALSGRPAGATVVERALEDAFVACLRERIPDAELGRQRACRLHTWPRVGPLDVVALSRRGTRGFELKWWGRSAGGRYQTLWDATKLASLVGEGQLEAAYLLSGGIRAAWDLDDPYTNLFEDSPHVTADLVTPPANWWALPTHIRTDVPAKLITSSVAQEPFSIDGISYELRLARIRPGEGRYRVPAREPRRP